MKRITLTLLALIALPAVAQAHPGHGDVGFASGLAHPFGGIDHLLAMLAVGLWAAQMGGRAIWAIPATFVSVMILGGMVGMAGGQLPFVESGIAASLMALGLLVALGARMPMAFAMPLIALLAVVHGFAHGAEMPSSASGLTYTAGFVLATATLHLAGMASGILIQRAAAAPLARLAGAAVAITGICLVAV
jgi:urease accessory protein